MKDLVLLGYYKLKVLIIDIKMALWESLAWNANKVTAHFRGSDQL